MVPYVPFLQIVVSYPMNNLKHNSAQLGLSLDLIHGSIY